MREDQKYIVPASKALEVISYQWYIVIYLNGPTLDDFQRPNWETNTYL